MNNPAPASLSAEVIEEGLRLLGSFHAADHAVAHAPDTSGMLIAEMMDAKDEIIDWISEHLPALLLAVTTLTAERDAAARQMAEYTAASLAEIAEAFETFASDQIGCVRWQPTKKAKAECLLKAEVWRDAAQMLRNTTLKATP